VNTCWEFDYDNVTVTLVNIKYGEVAIDSIMGKEWHKSTTTATWSGLSSK